MSKIEVLSAFNKYEKYLADKEERNANYADMVDQYYNFTNSFFEFDWGESFHMAPRWKGESLRESLKRHEHFIALQLGLKRGQKVLDLGCGIDGPLREIARFSLTSVTGLTNNEYQVSRGIELNRIAGLDKTCDYVKADFMQIPYPDNTFDAVYAIEAILYAPDAIRCYKEIYRVLKPGQCFVAHDWCMTDCFNPNNQEHQKMKAALELGHGLPNVKSTKERLEAVKLAGFEVIWEKNLAEDSPVPWYYELDPSKFSLNSFHFTSAGRFIKINMVKALEFVGLAPQGSQKVQSFHDKSAAAILEAGRKEIFTPMYFFLVRKPL